MQASKLPKLVLLPGLDGIGRLFAPLVDALPAELETLVVSYPSDRFLSYPELLDLLRLRAPANEPFVLLAESFSTPLAIRYAADRPGNLVGVILCAGFASTPARGAKLLLARLVAPLLFRLRLTGAAARRWLLGANCDQAIMEVLRAAVASVQPDVLSARLQSVLHCNVSEDLGRISVPILYLQATRDKLVDARSGNEILQAQPAAELVQIDGPHLLLQTRPQICAEVVINFLRTLPTQPANTSQTAPPPSSSH